MCKFPRLKCSQYFFPGHLRLYTIKKLNKLRWGHFFVLLCEDDLVFRHTPALWSVEKKSPLVFFSVIAPLGDVSEEVVLYTVNLFEI